MSGPKSSINSELVKSVIASVTVALSALAQKQILKASRWILFRLVGEDRRQTAIRESEPSSGDDASS